LELENGFVGQEMGVIEHQVAHLDDRMKETEVLLARPALENGLEEDFIGHGHPCHIKSEMEGRFLIGDGLSCCPVLFLIGVRGGRWLIHVPNVLSYLKTDTTLLGEDGQKVKQVGSLSTPTGSSPGVTWQVFHFSLVLTVRLSCLVS